jgi:GNAT superfamily N-acetyltransferase
MTTTHQVSTYPKEVSLRDGSTVIFRPLDAGDEAPLLLFFGSLSEDDKYYLKDDVASPALIGQWVHDRELGKARTIVAVANDGRIVAEGALVGRRGAARRHLADARLVVAEDFRNRGLGTALLGELCDIAREGGLRGVLMEAVEDKQADALAAADWLGFVRLGRISGGALDEDGRLHDLVLLALPIARWRQSPAF